MSRTNDLLKAAAVFILAMMAVAAIVILMAGSAVANETAIVGEWDIDITEEPESIVLTNSPGFRYAAEPADCLIDGVYQTTNCPDIIWLCTPGMSIAALERIDASAAPYNLRILGLNWASRETHCFPTDLIVVPNPTPGTFVPFVPVVAPPTIMFTG